MAIETVEAFAKKKKKAESKKTNTQEDLENVNAGKKSVRTLFKNTSDTGGMVSSIENVSNSKFLNILFID